MQLPDPAELQIKRLGECKFPSPLVRRGVPFVDEQSRVLVSKETPEIENYVRAGEMPPSFEQAGPRSNIFFNPAELTAGIVTAGGLCPGLNDVIRSIVMTLTYAYGVRRIVGFRYGYAGLTRNGPAKPELLTPDMVAPTHDKGGSLLGSSRGDQDVREMVDALVGWDVGILFTIGGDGTLRGASAIAAEIARRNLPISVIGVPKTIDNDLAWTQRSFGFITAVHEARPAIKAAHAEAIGALNGVGLVKLMGRHSGFIAVHASLANPDVNFCLIPEVPFTLEGKGGFLEALAERLRMRRHAVVVVAEGAGQNLIEDADGWEHDASGNRILKDIGVFLSTEIRRHCQECGLPVSLKYIDPSYTIRSQVANSNDSSYCLVLGQNAVHAGMCGRTDLVIGYWNDNFTHVPIELATRKRKQVDPAGEEWQFLLLMTGQPASMAGE